MIILFLLVSQLFASPEIYKFDEAQLNLKFGAEYFTTSQNFEDSSISALATNFYQTNPFIKARYDWNKELSTYGLVNLSSFTAGFNYVLGYWLFKHHTLLELNVPFQNLNTSSTNSLLSDGVFSVRAGDYFFKQVKNFTWVNYLGFKYRGSPLSTLFEWKTLADWQIKKFNLGVGFSGFFTMIADADTNNGTARRNYLNLANQGSLKYASINPTLVQVDATFGYRVARNWEINLDLSQSLTGIRYAHGFTTMLYLNYKKNPQDKIWYKKSDEAEGFEYQEDQAELDQDLF